MLSRLCPSPTQPGVESSSVISPLVVGPAVGESAPHAMHYFRIDFLSLS